MKRRIRDSLFILLLVILTGCTPKIMIYEDSEEGEVFISESAIYDAMPPFQHPLKLTEEVVAKMMKSMTCETYPAFSETEIKRFADKIAKGLKKTKTNSFVSFYISEQMIRNIASGEVYVKEGKVFWYFYPASEIFQRSPVVSDRLKCLGTKKFVFTLKGDPATF